MHTLIPCSQLFYTIPFFPTNQGLSILQSLFFFFFLVLFFRAAPTAYGSSQARGQIGAAAAGLHHSHSNVGSMLRLQPTPQLMATLDPSPTD